MKRYFRSIILSASVLTLMIGAPYIRATCETGMIPIFAFTGGILGCGGEKDSSVSVEQKRLSATVTENQQNQVKNADLKVTFVELGSINCIPCKMMQPVMKEIENKYPGQVKVVFHDVWTPQGRESGALYKIRVIPTQVFLDKDGKEYFRHEGFFPFEEVDKILKKKGVR